MLRTEEYTNRCVQRHIRFVLFTFVVVLFQEEIDKRREKLKARSGTDATNGENGEADGADVVDGEDEVGVTNGEDAGGVGLLEAMMTARDRDGNPMEDQEIKVRYMSVLRNLKLIEFSSLQQF